MTPQEQAFIAAIAPKAQEIQRKYGVPASIVIAQAALESGWGQYQKGNNLFGIKAGKTWNGATVDVATHEYTANGERYAETDAFRAYATTDASIEDHGKFLTGARYAGVRAAGNAYEAADALQRAGYATSPEYAAQLKNIISRDDLTRFDDASYRNYAANKTTFEETRRRLSDEISTEPATWNDFMNGFCKLLVTSFIQAAVKATTIQTSAPGGTTIVPPLRTPVQVLTAAPLART